MMTKPSSKRLPLRPDKTIDWLNNSRNDWKDKTLQAKANLKVAKQARKRAEISRKQWKEHCKQLEADQTKNAMKQRQKEAEIAQLRREVAQLEQENAELKKKVLVAPTDPYVERHSFPQSLITWGLRLLRTASAGFRLVSAWFSALASHEKIERAPKTETLIQWELKIGLYKLERSKEVDQEWIWMADHVIRLGSFKCFVVVGVRISSLRAKGNLTVTLEDLEPMAIIPMRVSNGELVSQKLEVMIKKLNLVPSALVIDHGSDLYAGAKVVAKNHPGIHLKYDVCHKIACELKRRLQTESWSKMTRCATETKKALSLGPYAKFAPPQQRSKARYMNLDSLVDWGNKLLQRYDQLPIKVQEKTKWILSLKNELVLWKEWIQIGQITRDIIRIEGFYEGVESLIMDRIIALNLSETSEELAQSLVDYVSVESEGIPYDRRMIGSTEALEGLFGGYKRMAGDNRMSVNGLGRLILCMSSRIGEFSEEIVHAAMTNIKCIDVKSWLNRAFAYESDVLEEKQEHFLQGEVCNF